jgi:tetratricopeptide (TPR) repeat protein
MRKSQVSLVVFGIGLFALLFFGFDTKSSKHKRIEKSRKLNMELTSLPALLMEAKSNFSTAQMSSVISIEQKMSELAQEDTVSKIEYLKELSGAWYKLSKPEISASYAVQVAELEDNDEAWSIAGTTFMICLQNTDNPKTADYCFIGAVSAFEKAISFNPSNLAHRVNLALCFAEKPVSDDPMKGIKMLIDLNQSNPGEPIVLNTLAILALQTGQNERALERLKESIEIDPDNLKTICLLAQVYQNLDDLTNANYFRTLCKN